MKAPNGYGTVYKLSGNRRNPWTARIQVGYKINSRGNPSADYRFLGYFKTRREAVEALAEYNYTKSSENLLKRKITLRELFDKYLQEYDGKSLDGMKSTYKIFAPIQDVNVHLLNREIVKDVFDKSGKSSSYLIKAKYLLRKLLNIAYVSEYITKEKMELILSILLEKPTPTNPHKRMTQNDINLLWQNQDNPYCQLALVKLYTGLRSKELFAIQKSDVHLKERYIHIETSKTAASKRDVPIPLIIHPIVKTFIETNLDTFIPIPKLMQTRYPEANFRRWMQDFFPDSTKPHDTRHTFISMLQEIGCPAPILKSIVGHSGNDVTERVYTHISMQTKLEWVDKLSNT